MEIFAYIGAVLIGISLGLTGGVGSFGMDFFGMPTPMGMIIGMRATIGK